jgi:hypothetical protein
MKDPKQMTIPIAHASASRVRAALDGRHDLSAAQTNDIIDTLLAAGLCTADVTGDGRLHAAAVSHANALENEARRTAARLGIKIGANGTINADDLASGLSGYSVEARLRYKSMFASCGMIQ